MRELREVKVNEEGLIFRRGRVLPESFVDPHYGKHYRRPRGYAAFIVKNYLVRRGQKAVASALWAIDNFSFASYHHWLVDTLARLVDPAVIEAGQGVLLLPASFERQPYVAFTLRAFPEVTRVAWIGAGQTIRVDKLVAVPRPAEYRPPVLMEVARRVLEVAGSPGTARRVYFSRADASRRRARNERDVRRILEADGFEVVQIDVSDPAAQVRAAAGADFVVGVHGAALSNEIFMPARGRILELRRAEVADVFFFDHYRWLARALGLSYRAQHCAVADAASGYGLNQADLLVDLDELRENLGTEWGAPPPPEPVPVGFGARPRFDD